MTQELRTPAQAAKDAVVFKALANAVRLQIVSFVAASPQGQVSAGEIVDRFELSQPTISHHLRVLREAGVLTTYKSSTFVYYRFAPTLQETVTSVLPSTAAAEPPSDLSSQPKKPATSTPVSAGSTVGQTASGSKTASGGKTAEDSKAAEELNPSDGSQKPLEADGGAAMATEADTRPGADDEQDLTPKGAKDKSPKPKDKKSKKDKRSKKDKKK